MIEKLTARELAIYELGAAGVSVAVVESILLPRARLDAMKASLEAARGEVPTVGHYEYAEFGPTLAALQERAMVEAARDAQMERFGHGFQVARLVVSVVVCACTFYVLVYT